MTHDDIWEAIDGLAARNAMSVSRLARTSGLDPTTFNKSKRVGADGRLRWPSTESISKVLTATDTSLGEMMDFGGATNTVRVPVIGVARAGEPGFFDAHGCPTGEKWDEIEVPAPGDMHAFALEVTGESMLPAYRDGDILIVSPQASPRRGDRVVVHLHGGKVLAKELVRQTANTVELASLNPDHPDMTFDVRDIVWMARVVWASQ